MSWRFGKPQELDDYTYRVAGCVGEFWTRMCRAHLFPSANLNDAFLLSNGVRFGKGLQLVNILRDLPVDLRHGRCYLPSAQLHAHGLNPQDLLLPANESRLRPVYELHLDTARAHLAAGWRLCQSAASSLCEGPGLACAWPLLIGRQTLDLLRAGRVLNPDHRVKVTRNDVRAMLFRSVLSFIRGQTSGNASFSPAFRDH